MFDDLQLFIKYDKTSKRKPSSKTSLYLRRTLAGTYLVIFVLPVFLLLMIVLLPLLAAAWLWRTAKLPKNPSVKETFLSVVGKVMLDLECEDDLDPEDFHDLVDCIEKHIEVARTKLGKDFVRVERLPQFMKETWAFIYIIGWFDGHFDSDYSVIEEEVT